jgi:2-isopropylmalate synthase
VKQILFNDITLRDGEQAPGVNFYPEEKLQIAKQLARMNIPIIEAGFPAASKSDFEGVKLVATELGVADRVICAMARVDKKDIEIAWEAVKYAEHPRIQVVLSTSDIHLRHQMKISRGQALLTASEMITYAKRFVEDVEFAAMDATRTELNYLINMCKTCAEFGAKTIELPDTVGYAIPRDYARMVEAVVLNLPDDVVVATHCHNDLGLATANTLAGIEAGARQAECTVNGIGERVGNAALEEVIMALKVRQEYYNVELNINTSEIMKTSELVAELSGVPIAVGKPIVGRNAFLHESGIHQHGLIANRETYQFIDPQDIGRDSFSLTIGKLSGSHALKKRIKELGFKIDDGKFKELYEAFKDLAGKKKLIVDEDIITLVGKVAGG